MTIKQEGTARSADPRIILNCSPDEAALIRLALRAYCDAKADEDSELAKWAADLGYALPFVDPSVTGYKVALSAGRWKYFDTFEDANKFAGAVFKNTGVLVALVQYVKRKT